MNAVASAEVRAVAEPQAGWPRPRGTWLDESRDRLRLDEAEPETLPIPWVLACDEDGTVSWTVFHGQAHTAHHDRLCQVCGGELGDVVILGLAEIAKAGKERAEEPRTSGPGCHPRCMALTLSFCPHFRDLPEDETVAFAYRGSGLGYLVFDQPSEAEATPAQIEEVYTATVAIAPDAVPLKVSDVKDLARRDPMGTESGARDEHGSSPAPPVT